MTDIASTRMTPAEGHAAATPACFRLLAALLVLATASTATSSLARGGPGATHLDAPAAVELWVPVASHNPGQQQSQWRSDLGILNAGTVNATIQLTFFGGSGAVSSTTYVPAGAQSILTDVVGQIGGSGSGAVRILSDQPVKVTARTYNQVPSGATCYANGTQGQSYPAVLATDGLSAGGAGYLAGLSENASYRCNIGVVNVGSSAATVLVELFREDGTKLTDYAVPLTPGQWAQETQPFKHKAGQTAMDRGYARITAQSGSGVLGFASVVDNITNDPTTVTLSTAAPVAPVEVAIAEYSAGLTAGAQPQGITTGPDGALWFAEWKGNRIGRISTSGAITEYAAGITPGATVECIAAGPDGALWFAESKGHRIGRITTSGVVTEFSQGITAKSGPVGITAGPDGALWFTEMDANKIGRITTAGVVTEFSRGITLRSLPNFITAGPDGALWFTEFASDKIGRITTAGEVTEFSAGITPGAGLVGITAGPDGALWFTEWSTGRVGRITTAGVVTEFSTGITPFSSPHSITAGPDGALWFTEWGGNRIGRITTAGEVTEYTAGITALARPAGITVGPDGALWFTEDKGSRIGRITGPWLAPPPPAPVWVPVASHNPGQHQSQWRTDLGILNAGAATASVEVRLHGAGGIASRTVSVPSGAQSILTDVVGQLDASGSGPIEVLADRPVTVTSRTYNLVPSAATCYANGTQGQGYPAVLDTDGLSAQQSAHLAGLSESSAYRCNIGLVNVGTDPASVLVELFRGDGTRLAEYTVPLAAGQWAQETQPFKNKAGQKAMDRGYAKITVQSGSGVLGFASVIDNLTNDPTTITMQP